MQYIHIWQWHWNDHFFICRHDYHLAQAAQLLGLFYRIHLPSLMRFLRPNVPILSQKLSLSFFAEFGVRGDFGRGEEAIFLVYVSRMAENFHSYKYL